MKKKKYIRGDRENWMWPKNRWERECNGQSDTLRLFGQVFSSILMASCIEIDRYGLIPLAVAPLPCRRPSSKTLVLTRPSSKFSLGLVLHGPRTVFRINRRRFITAVARTEPDRRGEDSATEVLQFCVFDNWFVFFFWWLRKNIGKDVNSWILTRGFVIVTPFSKRNGRFFLR